METDFEKRKKSTLNKIIHHDRSKQGFIDEEIKDLVETINTKKNLYTTSSCAGRILVLFRPNTKNKSDVTWIYKSHKESNIETIFNKLNLFLKENKDEGILFFKQEPMIIHIATKDLETAQKIIELANNVGFKKKGMISLKRKIIEITSSNIIEFPIGINNQLKIEKEILSWVLNFANKNIKKNQKMIEQLNQKFKEEFN